MHVSLFRRVMQLTVFVAVVVAGIRLATGASMAGIERYCPFGGLETAWSVVTRQQFSCAMGEVNVSLFLAVVVLALVARKAFCGWLCPVGLVHEGVARLGGWLRRRTGRERSGTRRGLFTVPPRADRWLRLLRLPVLLAILVATGVTGELVFRPYDPYYVMFSAHGHDVQIWSYALLGTLLAAGLVVSMAWCRYLCPLGGALWPLSRVGLLRMARAPESCTSCGRCDGACPHGLAVSSVPEVRSGDCTMCLECRDACPTEGALRVSPVGWAGTSVPSWILPLLLVVLGSAGVAGSRAFALPSYSETYASGTATEVETVHLVVRGVRCVDTARRAAAQLQDVPGVLSLVAYASRNELKLEVDPHAFNIEAVRAALESPVYDEETDQYLFHQFEVLEVR